MFLLAKLECNESRWDNELEFLAGIFQVVKIEYSDILPELGFSIWTRFVSKSGILVQHQRLLLLNSKLYAPVIENVP